MFTSLTGCAFIVPDNTKALEEKAITIGTTVLSKKEVVDLWYAFYSENSSYFYSYTNDQILNIFYKNVICKYAIIQETEKLIEDDVLMYSTKNDAEVWLDVLEHISSNVDTYEKALYKQQGVEDKNLPARLQTEAGSSTNTEVKSYLYSEYEFKGMDDYACDYLFEAGKTAATNYGKAVKSTQVTEIMSFLNTFLKKTPVELEEDEELEFDDYADLKDIVNSNTKYFTTIANTTNRDKAFEMYVGKLMLTAKSNGKASNRETVLFEEIKRLYTSYFETCMANMYKSYVNSLVATPDSEFYSLSDEAIVARYLQLVGSDIQKYQLEDNYIAVLEGSQNNTLLLYRYNGEYYYFTVQHLLVGFDESITTALKGFPGSSANASPEQYAAYKLVRDNFYNQIGLTSRTGIENWLDYNNATYRDDKGYDVYKITVEEQTFNVYFDSTFVAPETEEEVEEDDKLNGYYYVDATSDKADDNDRVYLTKAEFDSCKKATVKVETVVNEFNTTYGRTISILEANSTASAKDIHDALVADAEIKYAISEDLITAYLNAANKEEIEYKIYTNLFMQHAFKYSSDSASLGTSLSNYVGMIISGQPDNHNVGGSTYVSEFTNGARVLADQLINSTQPTNISTNNFVVTDYGIHMIVVNDVYKVSDSAPITGNDVLAEKIFGSKDNVFTEQQIEQNVADAVEKMQQIYVSSSSSQTLYQYMYELIRDELVGSSGKAYSKQYNKIYADYYLNSDLAKHDYEFTYDELMDLIG